MSEDTDPARRPRYGVIWTTVIILSYIAIVIVENVRPYQEWELTGVYWFKYSGNTIKLTLMENHKYRQEIDNGSKLFVRNGTWQIDNSMVLNRQIFLNDALYPKLLWDGGEGPFNDFATTNWGLTIHSYLLMYKLTINSDLDYYFVRVRRL